jgi:hypothetical protein
MPRRLAILWLLFLARGVYYCATLPLWEGWDEYAHFAYLEHATHTFALPRFDTPISREIDESMRLTPLADELRWIGPPYLTHPQFHALPPAEQAARLSRLAAIPPAWAEQNAAHPFVFYEAQQPPLYYWLLALPLRMMRAWRLETRVIAMRMLSMALASFAVPLTFFSARTRLDEPRAFCAAALLAAAPGFAIDVSRVANDALAIPLAALLCYLVMTNASWPKRGLVTGAGLLAKPYFLAFIVFGPWPAAVVALASAGWWYAHNVALGYSFSGWQDQAPLSRLFAAVMLVNWPDAARVTAKSFFWFGAWSFLTLKSWIYTLINGVSAVAAVPAFRKDLLIPWLFIAAVFAEMAYGVLNYQATHGIGSLPGWYAWVAGSMLAMVLAAGLGRAAPALIAALAVIDIYGATLLARHYHEGMVWICLIPLDLALLWLVAAGRSPQPGWKQLLKIISGKSRRLRRRRGMRRIGGLYRLTITSRRLSLVRKNLTDSNRPKSFSRFRLLKTWPDGRMPRSVRRSVLLSTSRNA